MHPDVAALLAVQDDDVAIHQLETRLAALRPRLEAMGRERDQAAAALEQARDAVVAEERRRREIAERIAQHTALQEKHQAVLNNITSMREATAATAQLEQARRMVDEGERERAVIDRRLVELNAAATEREGRLAGLEAEQRSAWESVAADQQELEAQIAEARTARDAKARGVPRSLLTRYDRIRTKRPGHAVFPLRGSSCSHCDTTVPLQRRSMMVGSGATELCEGCGVMLYATE